MGSSPTRRTKPTTLTHPSSTVERALALHATGYNISQISRATAVNRTTIRDWIAGRHVHLDRVGCFGCDDRAELLTGEYAYLLGLYLGDGCLSPGPRDVWRLRIVQDTHYPGLIALCQETIQAISGNKAGIVAKVGCVEIYGYWKHWTHLFPQAGDGPKHARSIELSPWQAHMVEMCPEQFLRGLVHSDGCRGVNKVRSRLRTGVYEYSYPRYSFGQKSDQIRRMFTDTCDAMGIHWTTANRWNIAVSRRADVAFLDTFIGPKH